MASDDEQYFEAMGDSQSIAGSGSGSGISGSSLPLGASATRTPPSPAASKPKATGSRSASSALGLQPQFNLESAETLLKTFMGPMVDNFPCIVLPDDANVYYLSSDRPFVLLAILAAASSSTLCKGIACTTKNSARSWASSLLRGRADPRAPRGLGYLHRLVSPYGIPFFRFPRTALRPRPASLVRCLLRLNDYEGIRFTCARRTGKRFSTCEWPSTSSTTWSLIRIPTLRTRFQESVTSASRRYVRTSLPTTLSARKL